MAKKSNPSAIHYRIVEVMKRFPNGLTAGQIRQELEREGLRADEQTHLDRRKRDLRKWFNIETRRARVNVGGELQSVHLYRFLGEKQSITDEGQINNRLRAKALHSARGRCQMCGRTVAQHEITLVVDHKVPRTWGGSNDEENLWAICEDCNAGKKDYFSSLNVDDQMMARVLAHESVHVRLGELLKEMGVGVEVPSYLLELVAGQDDWHKRLRELRYRVIGWVVEPRKRKSPEGKVLVNYVLLKYSAWPEDPTSQIRRFERARGMGSGANE